MVKNILEMVKNILEMVKDILEMVKRLDSGEPHSAATFAHSHIQISRATFITEHCTTISLSPCCQC